MFDWVQLEVSFVRELLSQPHNATDHVEQWFVNSNKLCVTGKKLDLCLIYQKTNKHNTPETSKF